MAEHDRPQQAQTTAFRHPAVPIADGVIDERRAGFAADIAESEPRDGSVPPPPPSRPAPTETLAARLRQRVEQG